MEPDNLIFQLLGVLADESRDFQRDPLGYIADEARAFQRDPLMTEAASEAFESGSPAGGIGIAALGTLGVTPGGAGSRIGARLARVVPEPIRKLFSRRSRMIDEVDDELDLDNLAIDIAVDRARQRDAGRSVLRPPSIRPDRAPSVSRDIAEEASAIRKAIEGGDPTPRDLTPDRIRLLGPEQGVARPPRIVAEGHRVPSGDVFISPPRDPTTGRRVGPINVNTGELKGVETLRKSDERFNKIMAIREEELGRKLDVHERFDLRMEINDAIQDMHSAFNSEMGFIDETGSFVEMDNAIQRALMSGQIRSERYPFTPSMRDFVTPDPEDVEDVTIRSLLMGRPGR